MYMYSQWHIGGGRNLEVICQRQQEDGPREGVEWEGSVWGGEAPHSTRGLEERRNRSPGRKKPSEAPFKLQFLVIAMECE